MEIKLINENIYFDLINQISEDEIKKVDSLKVTDVKASYDNKDNFELKSIVDGNKTFIKVAEGDLENFTCECDEYKETYSVCKHIIASVKEFISNEKYIKEYESNNSSEDQIDIKDIKFSKEKYKEYNQLIKAFYNLVLNQDQTKKENTDEIFQNIKPIIHIEPKIIYSRINETLKLEVKIGETQMYKIKSFPAFYDRFINKEEYKYGSKLSFVHDKNIFLEEDRGLLDFILNYAEIVKYANESATSNGYEYYTNKLGEDIITISNSGLDNLFEIEKDKVVAMEDEDGTKNVLLVPKNPDVKLIIKNLNDGEYALSTNIDVYKYVLLKGKKYTYFLLDKKLYRCTKKYEDTVIKILDLFRKNFTKEIKIPVQELSNFFSAVEPNIKDSLEIADEDYEEIKKYIPRQLSAKLFLDYDNRNNILADVRFIYDDNEFNPLNPKEGKNLISRNMIQESKLLNMLLNSGFLINKNDNKLILLNEADIYNFLSNEIEIYMKNFEVLATETFKSKEIKKSEGSSLGVKIENNLLDIDLENLKFDLSELQEIMKKYKEKKKYYRLKDGNFIDLENNDIIEFIDDVTENIDIDYSRIDFKNKDLKLPMYRSLYLDKILEKFDPMYVNKDESFKELTDSIVGNDLSEDDDLPKGLDAKFRNYQKVGYNWLRTLDKYSLGGILADDMGLGKTLQSIAVITKYVEDNKDPKPTLIVAPSSLSLNWKAEFDKFAKKVKVEVINGAFEDRLKIIKNIKKYNVVITSYELLKRDLEEYEKEDVEFKYIFADEAQYIKNNNTKNAKAIKKIKAETRFALTGTPIENSLSELWSIFDFIMPGYLFSYKKFKELYEIPITRAEDGESDIVISKLKKLIEPFVLRRIKKEVLQELPDKMITVLNSEMTDEQRDIYMSYLARAKKNAMEEIKEKGIEKSQIKILALLTRLRQICCHPGLFIENYNEESGKLNQCVEIIKDAIEAGHKILLFSGYTSMFGYIEEELKKENIKYLKFTGQTKVSERLSLVDEFNNNDDVKLFLISLKAGGTGINLTGADMVIHYDPWWNLSAENQATDRTYRIGQKKNVQVYKLITKNSIEEKIYELQNRKEALIDNMLSNNQTFISKLSKEEIMSLFE